ncbi:MAG: indole-3-glycerol phosphate synthase TrpC [Balneolales bacterium]|nr:indole-3-glycerol phosphate synthase TrpC [Balneolales bacterium]
MNILDKIVETTREELTKRKKKLQISDFKSFPLYEEKRRSLYDALRSNEHQVRIIAEVKKASPSKGIIREDFKPVAFANDYAEAGAAAISVLTEPFYFKGAPEFLAEIRPEVGVPLLRKDFIVDFYQIEEARAFGADAILLIAGITDGSQLEELHHAATEAGLCCLVESYSEEEFRSLNFEIVKIAGVNNRDLKTFEVDVHRGLSLLSQAPEQVAKVSESGLSTAEDLRLIKQYGCDAALIGEHFMRQNSPGEALNKMLDDLHELLQREE